MAVNHQLVEMSPLRRNLEYLVRAFVFYSVGMYLVELEFSGTNRSTGFWLWNERCVALFFTLEYLIRWLYSDNKHHYPFKILSIIDLVAVLPFYVGFFVTPQTLGIIRTLRVLRLFKLVRYNPALLNVLAKISRIKKDLLVVSYVVGIFVVLSKQPSQISLPNQQMLYGGH